MSPHQRASSAADWSVGEVTADQVWALGGGRVGDGGLLPPTRRTAVAVDLAHQARNPLAGPPLSLIAQFVMDSRGTIGLAGRVVDLDDLGGQDGVAQIL